MGWENRIREAAYTSPGGKRITFDYENLRKTFDKKGTSFDFPDANGTYIQDMGHTGQRFPLRIFFWGDNYDLQAEEFESILLERGVGRLEHPIYGVVNVVPFGTITRRDDLKTAANQTIVDVTFWETINLIYPTVQVDPANEVVEAINDYNIAAASKFSESAKLIGTTERSIFAESYKKLLNNTRGILKTIADKQANVREQYDNIYNSINSGINILIAKPLTLAMQTMQLIQSPSRAITSINARLEAYTNLARSIIRDREALVSPWSGSMAKKQFHIKDLYASTYITGSILSVVNNEFVTKSEALKAAEQILTQSEELIEWQDNNYQALREVDAGETYQRLQNLITITVGFLVNISFSLKQEIRIVLDHNESIISLVARLYGSVDDKLNFFIRSNNLTGSEILELRRGREIVYYV